MKVAIVGNGFDLMHDLETSYNSFFHHLEYNGYGDYRSNNIIYRYLKNINGEKGWIDLEHELLVFFEELCRFVNMMEYDSRGNKGYVDSGYFIQREKYITSTATYVFYETMISRGYDFFNSTAPDDSIQIKETEISLWNRWLIQSVCADFDELVLLLTQYLKKIQSEKIPYLRRMSGDCIETIISADKIFTFNYTNTLELYSKKKIHYVHGSLDQKIILGIPFSNRINIPQLQKYFKISQSSCNSYNIQINDNKKDLLELYFIGFSFGESDHYFFQEIKKLISYKMSSDFTNMPPIHFHFYAHTEAAKYTYINNLILFLGEDTYSIFDKYNRIHFHEYE